MEILRANLNDNILMFHWSSENQTELQLVQNDIDVFNHLSPNHKTFLA